MRFKLRKRVIFIITIFIIIFLITMLIPIKFCVSTFPTDSGDDFYIIRYSRDKIKWFVIGDKNGLFDENLLSKCIARPKGENRFKFTKEVSVELYMQGNATSFIVYGTATMNDDWDNYYYGDTTEFIRYTIDDTEWDIWGEVHTDNSLRSIFLKSYLNIYDLKWFDNLRDQIYGFLDGETNF